MTVFEIKQGDTAPSFDKRLRSDRGHPIDVTDSAEISFHMRDNNYNTVIDDDTSGGVSIQTAVSGDVSYDWSSGDTTDIGSYEAEFVVTFNDGSAQSFPRNGMYNIEVTEDIHD